MLTNRAESEAGEDSVVSRSLEVHSGEDLRRSQLRCASFAPRFAEVYRRSTFRSSDSGLVAKAFGTGRLSRRYRHLLSRGRNRSHRSGCSAGSSARRAFTRDVVVHFLIVQKRWRSESAAASVRSAAAQTTALPLVLRWRLRNDRSSEYRPCVSWAADNSPAVLSAPSNVRPRGHRS